MNIIVLTPVRLLGDGLASCLSSRPQFTAVVVVNLLLSALLIPGRGIEGAAWACVLVSGVQVAGSLACILHALRSSSERVKL